MLPIPPLVWNTWKNDLGRIPEIEKKKKTLAISPDSRDCSVRASDRSDKWHKTHEREWIKDRRIRIELYFHFFLFIEKRKIASFAYNVREIVVK